MSKRQRTIQPVSILHDISNPNFQLISKETMNLEPPSLNPQQKSEENEISMLLKNKDKIKHPLMPMDKESITKIKIENLYKFNTIVENLPEPLELSENQHQLEQEQNGIINTNSYEKLSVPEIISKIQSNSHYMELPEFDLENQVFDKKKIPLNNAKLPIVVSYQDIKKTHSRGRRKNLSSDINKTDDNTPSNEQNATFSERNATFSEQNATYGESTTTFGELDAKQIEDKYRKKFNSSLEKMEHLRKLNSHELKELKRQSEQLNEAPDSPTKKAFEQYKINQWKRSLVDIDKLEIAKKLNSSSLSELQNLIQNNNEKIHQQINM